MSKHSSVDLDLQQQEVYILLMKHSNDLSPLQFTYI